MATTTMTVTKIPSASTTTTSTIRPRRSSKSKHLNLWRDIDSPLFSEYQYASQHSSPPWPINLIAKYSPAPIRTRLENVSPQTYDLVIATFFSALAIVVLSIMFIGPRISIITSVMGTYALGFGICVGFWELVRLVDDRSGAGSQNQNQNQSRSQ